MKKIILSAAAVLFAAFLLVFSGDVRKAVSGAIFDCLEIIVPSLFVFSALAIYLQKSGLYKTAFKPLTFLLSKIFKTDEELGGLFLLSNLGGYPVGAALITALINENRLEKKDAERLMCCCFGSGPSFIIGMVGKVVFNSALLGTVLFVSCFLSSLCLAAWVFGNGKITLKSTTARYDLSAGCFISSVSAAAKAILSVCMMIVVFSAVTAAVNTVLGGHSSVIFSSILEVTRIKEMTAGEYSMPICSALLSLGGMCVALQITAIVSGSFPLGKFLLSRIVAAALSAGFSAALTHIIPSAAEEALSENVTAAAFSGSAPLSICLIAMCAILLADKHKKTI